jgi:hypothetical protein
VFEIFIIVLDTCISTFLQKSIYWSIYLVFQTCLRSKILHCYTTHGQNTICTKFKNNQFIVSANTSHKLQSFLNTKSYLAVLNKFFTRITCSLVWPNKLGNFWEKHDHLWMKHHSKWLKDRRPRSQGCLLATMKYCHVVFSHNNTMTYICWRKRKYN